MFEKFTSLCDEVFSEYGFPQLKPQPDDEHDKTLPLPARRQRDILGEEIIEALAHNDPGLQDKLLRDSLRKMEKGCIFHKLIDGRYTDDYYDILDTIILHIPHDRKYLYPLDDKQRWTEGIKAARDLLEISGERPYRMEDHRQKEYDIASHAVKLRKLGCAVTVDDCSVKVGGTEGLERRIYSAIRRIGGRRFLETLFSTDYGMEYVPELERFMVRKPGNRPVQSDIPVMVPFGYLINLGFRAFREEGDPGCKVGKEFPKILDLSRSLAFVKYPVQQYSIWENIFHGDHNPIEFFTDLVVHGSIYEPTQVQSRYSLKFCRYLIGHIDHDKLQPTAGVTLAEFAKIMEYMAARAEPGKFVRCFGYEIAEELGLPRERADRLMKIISLPSKEINNGYSSPLDHMKINIWQKPLIEQGNGEYYIIPASFGSFAFYESLASLLRENGYKNFDGEVGYLFEEFINEEFAAHGITLACGRYNDDKFGEGECDILVESQRAIVLFECKKKPLTRASRSGKDYKIFTDLAGCILDSQIQCMRTECVLREKGSLRLEDGTVIPLGKRPVDEKGEEKDRTVDRVSLSLADFAMWHDRTILQSILKDLYHHNFHIYSDSTDEQELKELEQLRKEYSGIRKKQEAMREYMVTLRERNPFFNSWSLNFHQLLFLIEGASGNDDFYSKLSEWKYSSMGTNDLYQEYYLRNILPARHVGG